MITVKNLRKEKPRELWDIIVDRRSVLGNPFHIDDKNNRDKVCDMYNILLKAIMEDQEYIMIPSRGAKRFTNHQFREEMNRLIDIYKNFGFLNLFCWCTPKRCHAESIKRYILEVGER